MRFEDEKLKVIFTGLLFNKVVVKWYKPYVRRYYKYYVFTDKKVKKDFKERYTVNIFNYLDTFIGSITVEFGELNAECKVE